MLLRKIRHLAGFNGQAKSAVELHTQAAVELAERVFRSRQAVEVFAIRTAQLDARRPR
jgi:hypothetical protein